MPRVYDYEIAVGNDPLFGPVTILDNQSSVTTLINFGTYSGRNFMQLQYSISRGGNDQTGRLMIVTDGVNISLTDEDANTSPAGVSFSAALSGSNILLQYTSTSTSFNGSFKYYLKSWA